MEKPHPSPPNRPCGRQSRQITSPPLIPPTSPATPLSTINPHPPCLQPPPSLTASYSQPSPGWHQPTASTWTALTISTPPQATTPSAHAPSPYAPHPLTPLTRHPGIISIPKPT